MLSKEKMRKASQLAAYILEEVEKIIKPNICTEDIDNLCASIMLSNNAISGSLNFHGFPKSVCTSINDVVCHGIPNKKDILKEGDFVNVDVALNLEGYYGDTSRCFKVGKLPLLSEELFFNSYEAMWAAIKICKNNVPLKLIAHTIENFLKKYNYGIVRDFCGHGIGKKMHLEPKVLFYKNNSNYILKTGECITIEPMINLKSYKIKILSDGWTAKTIDGYPSCQWEHTIYIENDGCEILSFNNFDRKNNKTSRIKI